MSSYPQPELPPIVPPEVPAWGPFTGGELIRRTFALYRKHAAVVLGTAAVCAAVQGASQLPLLALNLLTSRPAANLNVLQALKQLPFFFGIFLISWLTSNAVYAWSFGSFVRLVLAWREGRTPSVTEALSEGGKTFGTGFGVLLNVSLRLVGWAMLGEFALLMLVVILGALTGLSAAKLSTGAAGAEVVLLVLLLLAGIVALFIFIVWQALRYSVAICVANAERSGVLASVRRSITLTRHRKGRLVALAAVVFACMVATGILLAPLFVMPMIAAMKHQGNAPMGGTLLALSIAQVVVVTLLLALVYLPVGGIGVSLCYLDLRAREATDVVPPQSAFSPGAAGVYSASEPVVGPTAPPPVDYPRSFHVDPGRSVSPPSEPLAPVNPDEQPELPPNT